MQSKYSLFTLLFIHDQLKLLLVLKAHIHLLGSRTLVEAPKNGITDEIFKIAFHTHMNKKKKKTIKSKSKH